jgi:dTDP-4-dehydrorhamnose 3,5-epimerase
MRVIEQPMNGLFHLEPTVYGDDRGYFFESFNKKKFEELTGVDVDFVQDNQSKSKKGVLRGLHFQNPPFAQGKLVRVVSGSVLDVVVDIRKQSSSYGEHFKVVLDAKKHNMLWIPPGFAHGFLTLEDDTIFIYKCSEFYNPDSEVCISWNDVSLNINWGVETPLVSSKDSQGLIFKDFDSNF